MSGSLRKQEGSEDKGGVVFNSVQLQIRVRV